MANSNPINAIGIQKEYSQFTDKCKAMAEKRRANSPVQVERTLEVLANIQNYIEEQTRTNKPLTHAGFMRCMGLGTDQYYNLDRYDHVVDEYKILHNLPQDATTHVNDKGEEIPLVCWSQIKQKVCDIAIQEQLETNCYTMQRGVNPAGSIFGLKARYGWTEDTATQHIDKAIIIADSEQAKKSLQMLMG